MKATRLSLVLFLVGALAFAVPTVRIKDIADLQGIRGNQLVGIGLVTGLSGRGDSQNSELLKAAIANLVSNFGFRIDPADVRPGVITEFQGGVQHSICPQVIDKRAGANRFVISVVFGLIGAYSAAVG